MTAKTGHDLAFLLYCVAFLFAEYDSNIFCFCKPEYPFTARQKLPSLTLRPPYSGERQDVTALSKDLEFPF